jgi:hypothetical protein
MQFPASLILPVSVECLWPGFPEDTEHFWQDTDNALLELCLLACQLCSPEQLALVAT